MLTNIYIKKTKKKQEEEEAAHSKLDSTSAPSKAPNKTQREGLLRS